MTALITTERLELKSFPANSEVFARALHEICADVEVMRFMNVPPHADAWATSLYIGKCAELELYKRGRAMALWERGSGRFVGVLNLAFEQPHAVAFGGYLHRDTHRKGYGVEATRAVAEWALVDPRIYRVSAQCDVRNDGAAKVLERAGFTLEGRLARAWPGFGEEPRDVFSFAITR